MRSFSTNLSGKVRNFPLPKNQPLVPLFEAIVNSINAIEERKEAGDVFDGLITIEVRRENSFFDETSLKNIIGFVVEDNGIGFTDENMSSFMEADSEHKLKIGGKGVGRFSWLKVFSSVYISSTFKQGAIFVKRSFEFNTENPYIDDSKETVKTEEFSTIIELKGILDQYQKIVPKHSEIIANKIVQHCFVYFLNHSCPTIILNDDDESIILNQTFNNLFSSTKTSQFNLGDYSFSLLSIEITDKAFPSGNRLYLCANERFVEEKNLEKLIVNLDSKIFDEKGFWYLGIITGDYLDQNVDMNRLSFNIPKDGSVDSLYGPCMDEIVSTSCQIIETYLSEYLNGVEKAKEQRIRDYTTKKAPQYRYLEHFMPNEIAKIKPGLSDNDLDNALYEIKRNFENKTKAECNKLFDSLDVNSISSDEYQKSVKNTINKIQIANSAALAEYIVHRRIILDLFRKGLNIKSDGKYELEEYLHQLIYPMKATSDELPYDSHNLWLIDEKLSFCQYVSSDKPFDNSSKEKRTDILVLDSPVVVSDSGITNNCYDSIVIFELKRPMRDNYNMEDNPVTQLQDYAKLILEGKVKDCNHRPIKTSESTRFYLYAVCDITPSLQRVLDRYSFTKTDDGNGAFLYNENLKSYVEVLSYDKLIVDSEKRNRVFFDKLGVSSRL